MKKDIVPIEIIENKIFLIRGKKVMLDRDLAKLYGVSTSVLNKAVSRNIDRFPEDFMFQLTPEEFINLKFHFGTSSWGGTRKLPRLFTEQGIAMLSGVLKSKRAVHVNIQIMRAFVKLREMLATHKDLSRKLAVLEKKYDKQFRMVFDAILGYGSYVDAWSKFHMQAYLEDKCTDYGTYPAGTAFGNCLQ